MSAVSLTASALAAAVLGCAVAGALGQAATGRARADTAADLGALAVAARVVRGDTHLAACGVGATVVSGPDTTMTGCEVAGEVVTVQVREHVAVLGLRLPVVGRARAGPVPP